MANIVFALFNSIYYHSKQQTKEVYHANKIIQHNDS